MTKLIGILNITPDSFSDGGRYTSIEAAVAAAKEMLSHGADKIDIGAESTRPGATALSHEEEWARLEPVLAKLSDHMDRISIDSYHPETAQKAIEYSVSWINDVSGLTNPEMISLLAKHPHMQTVIMHNLGIPADPKHTMPESPHLMHELVNWFSKQIRTVINQGIDRDQIILDPGIGFG